MAQPATPPEAAAARAAQADLAHAEAEVRALEQQRPVPPTLSQARQRRAALAEAWRRHARAWAAAAPADPDAKTALSDADRAAKTYFMPGGVHED